jgi:hypothetical protein
MGSLSTSQHPLDGLVPNDLEEGDGTTCSEEAFVPEDGEVEELEEDSERVEEEGGDVDGEELEEENADVQEAEEQGINGIKQRVLASRSYQHIKDAIDNYRKLQHNLSTRKEVVSEDPLVNLVLQYVREGRTNEEIGDLIGKSVRTVARIKSSNGITKYGSDVPDSLIIEAMVEILTSQNLKLGWKMMQGYLKGLYDLQIGQPRTIELLRRAKAEIGVELNNKRRGGYRPLEKRVYSNAGVMDVLHIDFHDKLKHWGIYIHGAIDGHTRYCVWLFVTTSHKSFVVYEIFKAAVEEYGLPNRIRSDKGKEAVLLAFAQMRAGGRYTTGDSISR